MLRVVTHMTITQRANAGFTDRKKVILMEFVASYNWESKWMDLTDRGKITIPRKLYTVDQYNQAIPLTGSLANIGGFTEGTNPLFMRGDKVTLSSGYQYRTADGTWITQVSGTDGVPKTIEGYISKVYAKTPIEFDVEDNMWILKQTALSNKTFTATDTLENILKYIVNTANTQHGTTLTYSALTKTNFGQFLVQNETAAQLLSRLKKLYGFHSYFRGDELRCGILIYNIADMQKHVFIMNGPEGNVCDGGQDLEYQRKDDIVLSARAYNTVESSSGTCKDGTPKTKKERIEILATIDKDVAGYKVITKGEQVAEAQEGERRTFFYPGAKTVAELADLAIAELQKYYYTGLKGKFMSFGIPYVRHGDHVELRNPENPEQDGVYKVKGVEYTGAPANGLKQLIELDFRII